MRLGLGIGVVLWILSQPLRESSQHAPCEKMPRAYKSYLKNDKIVEIHGTIPYILANSGKIVVDVLNHYFRFLPRQDLF
jgi:hypothetical protein